MSKKRGSKKKRRRSKAIRLGWMFAFLFLLCFGSYWYFTSSDEFELAVTPDKVIEFGEKYPEAKEFVDNYPRYYGRDFSINVEEEMKERDIPLFIQWDKRWGYTDYGSSVIGVSGCGPTCISMVACGLEQNKDITPNFVAEMSENKGYYIEGQGTSWDLMTEGAKEVGLSVSSGSISSDYIRNNLTSESPLICSMKPGDFTYTGHFIVLIGFDEDGRVIVNDPNSKINSNKSWDVDTLVSQIKGIWKYSYN